MIDRFKVNWWRLRCWWWGRRVKVGYSTQSTDGLNSMALLVLTWLMLYCSFNNLPSLSLSLFHVLDNFTFETQKIITHVISIYSTYSTFSPYCPPPPQKKTNQPTWSSEWIEWGTDLLWWGEGLVINKRADDVYKSEHSSGFDFTLSLDCHPDWLMLRVHWFF